ncbi:MAG TPA: hypothetical protein VGO11_25395 [Chthoniobacteraceae bacterium]|jgi:hypothetical protein|nr:hypothetical protein [Chthoniobacteraceae bacterium]
MAAESDESPVLRAALIVVAVCVLYVLSIGPVYRYAGGLSMWFHYAYRPLRLAGERWDAVGTPLRWYLDVWGEDGGTKRINR